MSLFTVEDQKLECAICGRRIGKGSWARNLSHGKYRHEVCAPGTKRWLESEVGRTSSLAKYFKQEGR